MMLLDRTIQPKVRDIEHLAVQMPQRFIMPNGVPLNILNSGDNEVVRIDLLIEGGRWHQSQPLQALFTNRMLREGTLRYSALEIAEKLDYYGAWLELSSASEYAYITLYSLNKYLPQTLDVLESIVKEPAFPEKELGVVAENNIQQFIVNSSKVDFLAHRALMKAVYGGQHPCGRLVQKEDYKRITPDVLRKFYDRYYHSRNCTIYVSGKVGDDCVRRIEDLFGREAFGKGFQKPEKTDFIPVSSVDKRIFVEYADVMQSAVRMGMLSLERCHPDYLKARVMVTLFGGYFGSRLMSNIREEKGYTYGISAGIAPYPGQGILVMPTGKRARPPGCRALPARGTHLYGRGQFRPGPCRVGIGSPLCSRSRYLDGNRQLQPRVPHARERTLLLRAGAGRRSRVPQDLRTTGRRMPRPSGS